MKHTYVERATSFISAFLPFLEIYGFDTPDDVRLAAEYFNLYNNRRIKVCHGATRIALVNSDYVVKFNYGERVDQFGGCEEEVAMYQHASDEGMEYLLAKITRVEVKGYTFYVMPRARYIGKADLMQGNTEDDVDWLFDTLYDLHEFNFGIINGRAVVIDYACYDA